MWRVRSVTANENALIGGVLLTRSFAMLSTLFDFIGRLWQGIGLALSFSPDLLQRVEAYPESRTLIITMAILAGMSLLLGQSAVLFLNRVKPGRFIISLIVNGLLYTLSLMVWGLASG
jgi:hypothetical protein